MLGLKAKLLQCDTTMRQDCDKRIEAVQQRYKDYHDRKTRNAPLTFTGREYIYFDRPPMTTFAPERLANELCRKGIPERKDGLSYTKNRR